MGVPKRRVRHRQARRAPQPARKARRTEFGEPLETTAVRLACARANDAELAAIEEMLDGCQPGVPREEWHRVGTDFHVAIARLSGNPFLVKAIEGVGSRSGAPSEDVVIESVTITEAE